MKPILELSIDVNAIARPAQALAVRNTELVDFCLVAFSKADLSQAPLNEANKYRFKTPTISPDVRREIYEHWILSKAFQDLMRGVRLSLEQAYLTLQLIDGPKKAASNSTIEEFLAPFRKKAADKQFPDLLADVNAKLTSKLQFAEAYLSLQKARNCLEHRNGIIRQEDINADDCLELQFPRIKNFLVRNGEEIELLAGTVVNDGTEAETVQIFTRLEVRKLRFKRGEHLRFSLSDFGEIAFGCSHFGSALARSLSEVIPTSDAAARARFEAMPHAHPSHRAPEWDKQPDHIKDAFRKTVRLELK